jgi:membrane-associated phospholipid phosphatase
VPIVVLLVVAIAAGVLVWALFRLYPRPRAVEEAAMRVGVEAGRHARLRALARARLDPAAGTGLALTAALVLVICGGVVLGVLAYLVRTSSVLVGVDDGAARWGGRHATAVSQDVLRGVTQLGNIRFVLVLCVVLAVAVTLRERNAWVLAFLVAVVGGEEVITNVVKALVDRTRPAFNPAALTLGPSFPSGHSATSAAFYAAAALLVGRSSPRARRALFAGLAAAVAVAVASSRVLLDDHWLSDVVAGLALGWAWFAVCGIAFGGRILRFGAALEIAEEAAVQPAPSAARSRRRVSVLR